MLMDSLARLKLNINYDVIRYIINEFSAEDIVILNAHFPLLKNDIEKRFNVKLLTTDFLLSYLLQYLDAYDEKVRSPNPDINKASVSQIIDNDDDAEFGLSSDLKTPAEKKKRKKVQSTESDFNSQFSEATPYKHFTEKEVNRLNKFKAPELEAEAKEKYGIVYKNRPSKTDIIRDMEDASNNNFRETKNRKIVKETSQPMDTIRINTQPMDTTKQSLEKFFGKSQSGKGLSKESPIHKPFGNYRINIPKLKGNILHLSFPCGSPVRKVKPRYISNNFKEFLEYFIETQKFNENLYNQLSDAEKKHFYDCVKESGLYKTKDIKVNNPFKEQEMKEMNRFDILIGEIEAGNDNPKMVRELKTLLIKLTKAGKISRKESMETLEELTTLGL
jgi:hypothetical protein